MDDSTMKIAKGFFKQFLCALAVVGTGLPAGELFAANLGGPQAPIFESGVHLFAGDSGKSLTGARGYYTYFSAESRKGMLRKLVGAQFEFSNGTGSIRGSSPDVMMYGAGFVGGTHLYIFQEGRFQPFVGGSGILAWHFLEIPSPPTGVEAYTQGITYGFEVTGGVDIRFSNEGVALRLRGAYWYARSRLAGESKFILDGFRIGIGLVF